jgi:hypothetical protein
MAVFYRENSGGKRNSHTLSRASGNHPVIISTQQSFQSSNQCLTTPGPVLHSNVD